MKSTIILFLALADAIVAAPVAGPLPNPEGAVPDWAYYSSTASKRDADAAVPDWAYYSSAVAKREAAAAVPDWAYYSSAVAKREAAAAVPDWAYYSSAVAKREAEAPPALAVDTYAEAINAAKPKHSYVAERGPTSAIIEALP